MHIALFFWHFEIATHCQVTGRAVRLGLYRQQVPKAAYIAQKTVLDAFYRTTTYKIH